MELKPIPFYVAFDNVDELTCEIKAMDWFKDQLHKEPGTEVYIRCWSKPEREWDFEKRDWTPYTIVLRGAFFKREYPESFIYQGDCIETD